MLVKVHSITKHSSSIKTITLQSQEQIPYKPGQYAVLRREQDREGRPFSFSSSPTESRASITVKHAVGRDELAYCVGDTIHLSGLSGGFLLPDTTNLSLIFIAGGIGIAPVRSLVKWLSDKGHYHNISLFYSVKDRKDLVFLDVFKNYPLKLITAITGTDGDHMKRRICLEDVRRLYSEKPSLIYISGSKSMVQDVGTSLIRGGIDRQAIITDIPIEGDQI